MGNNEKHTQNVPIKLQMLNENNEKNTQNVVKLQMLNENNEKNTQNVVDGTFCAFFHYFPFHICSLTVHFVYFFHYSHSTFVA
jgi:hypothetical protein